MFRIDRSERNPNLISIMTGFTCNLSCTLCGPDASSKWQDELKEYMPPQDNDLYDTAIADFTGATSVTFGGGEPVLNKSTIPLLKKIDSSTAVNIHFNCTILPSKELLDECSRFKNITFILSIDDIEERFEFLRYPAKWDKAVTNIHWLLEHCPTNIQYSINTVISKLNEHTYHTVGEWVNANIAHDRINYIGTQDSNGILNVQNSTVPDEADWLDRLDTRRKTNWRETFPLATNIN